MNTAFLRRMKPAFLGGAARTVAPGPEPIRLSPLPPARHPAQILIVDDDPVILKTVSLKLNAHGYQTATALDASEAISAVQTDRPDLILLDISFPPDVPSGGRVSWDGFQLLSWLRNLNGIAQVPVIIITGGDPEEYLQKAFAAGAVAFFHKPIDHQDLLPAIEDAVAQSRHAQESRAEATFEI
jgi:CheY-like chemotaxis protein